MFKNWRIIFGSRDKVLSEYAGMVTTLESYNQLLTDQNEALRKENKKLINERKILEESRTNLLLRRLDTEDLLRDMVNCLKLFRSRPHVAVFTNKLQTAIDKATTHLENNT
jgi:hypothetical protein